MCPSVACWKAQRLLDSDPAEFRSGVPAESLATFERKHGVDLPAEMRELYALTNGMLSFDADFVELHPIEEVVPLRDFENCGPWSDGPTWIKNWFVFANYLINSHLYLVRLDATKRNLGPVVSWDGGDLRHPIAPSFSEFLEICLSPEDERLLHDSDSRMPEDWDEPT